MQLAGRRARKPMHIPHMSSIPELQQPLDSHIHRQLNVLTLRERVEEMGVEGAAESAGDFQGAELVPALHAYGAEPFIFLGCAEEVEVVFGEEGGEGFAADLFAREEEGEVRGGDVGFGAEGLGRGDEEGAVDLLAEFLS